MRDISACGRLNYELVTMRESHLYSSLNAGITYAEQE
jgi:hypothetical protein